MDDKDEDAIIDEEVHSDLCLLFSKPIDLDGDNQDDPLIESDLPYVKLGNAPSTKLVVVPLAIFPPSLYDDQHWDANNFL